LPCSPSSRANDLLRTVAGLESPTAGRLLLNGLDLTVFVFIMSLNDTSVTTQLKLLIPLCVAEQRPSSLNRRRV
jgi:hypothetical protein